MAFRLLATWAFIVEFMDELLSAVVALVLWRLVISVLGTVVLAVWLSSQIPSFTAEYCITLAIFGAALGIFWQGRADTGLALKDKVDAPAVSRPIAFVVLAIIGLSGGGFLERLFGSAAGGAVALLVCAGATALCFHFTSTRAVTSKGFAFSAVALLSGYLAWLVMLIWRTL